MRARQVETGREVQRVAVPANAGAGLASGDIAAEDMRRFLVRSGLATDDDQSWAIVEVHRLNDQARQPLPPSARERPALNIDPP
jgi:hypothetical protein